MLPASDSIDWNPIDVRRKPPLQTKRPNDCIACLSWTVIYTAVYSNCMSLGIPNHCVCTHSIANGSSHQLVNVSLRTRRSNQEEGSTYQPNNCQMSKSRKEWRGQDFGRWKWNGKIVSKCGKQGKTESYWIENDFDWNRLSKGRILRFKK